MENKKLADLKSLGRIGYILTTIVLIFQVIAFIGLMIASITVLFINIPNIDLNVESNSINTIMIEGQDREEAARMLDSVKEFISKYDASISFEDFEINSEDSSIISKDDRLEITTDGTKIINLSFEKYKILIPLFEMILAMSVTFYLRKIFNYLRNTITPFTFELKEILNRLGNAMMAAVAFPMISSAIFGIAELALVGYLNFQIEFVIKDIIIVLAIFSLVKIIDYGIDLQIESDETL